MKTAELRQKFLDFFEKKGHKIEKSVPIIPQDDPTLLFISAGMAAFKPYFLGLKKDISRAASCQKCFRTSDIENVGYTSRHHTFFEMLGNFSFGDYFKKEAISLAWEFITEELKMPSNNLHISVHHTDDEALEIWHKEIGIPLDRIVKLGDKDNFWTIGVGPSGPCSEIHIDQGEEIGCGDPNCAPGCECPRFLEFWNLVFTQYDRAEDGTLTPLERKNIDTGMGLERLAAILQGKTDNFENDVFIGIIEKIEELTGKKFSEGGIIKTALKVVADHIRALAIAIADGALPGNEGRGYVLRKILRRGSRFAHSYLGQDEPFLYKLVPAVAIAMDYYTEIAENQDHIIRIVKGEEERFLLTLKTGSEILNGLIKGLKKKNQKTLSGKEAFLLHDTYGFPLDLTKEICGEQNLEVDEEEFNEELEKQRERGRANMVAAFVNFSAVNPANYPATNFTGYESLEDKSKVLDIVEEGESVLIITENTPFYGEAGGQVGDSGTIEGEGAKFVVKATEIVEGVYMHMGNWAGEARFAKGAEVLLKVDKDTRRATMRNHTATHLLHKVLRDILGDHVKQAGSLVTPDRLRFDFTHFEAIKAETLEGIENLVNEHILEAQGVTVAHKEFDEAVKDGALALFGEKYDDNVRVISVGDYSMELCGGTHIDNSAEIGLFSIVSESSIAAGIRRIEAVTGKESLKLLHEMRDYDRELAKTLDCDQKSLLIRAEKLMAETRELKKEVEELRKSSAANKTADIKNNGEQIGEYMMYVAKVNGLNVDEMKNIADELVANTKEETVVLLGSESDKASFVLKVSPQLVKKGIHAGKIIKEVAQKAGGGGGGRPDMATAGGKDPEQTQEALNHGKELLGNALK